MSLTKIDNNNNNNNNSPRASLVNLCSSVVICNSTEGSTLADFLHTRTLNCREKSDEFQESSKRMVSECDVTSERYRTHRGSNICRVVQQNE